MVGLIAAYTQETIAERYDELKKNSEIINLLDLSMGMSNDFQIAVEEGATMIRIGTALFGKRR